MSFRFYIGRGTDDLTQLRRLVAARWLVIATMLLFVIAAPGSLDIVLPQPVMFSILAVAGLFNLFAQGRVAHASAATPGELLSQLLFDIGALGALIFFAGGATNPLVSLLLPPVAIAAVMLPGRHVAAVACGAVLTYSLLMVYYVPLPIADARRATQLHLVGMWLTFVVSAAMIAWLIVQMMRLLRERDTALAAAREQALRDERIMAMGTLAAGAAHELGTPLATMALIAGDLAIDKRLPEAVREDVGLLRQQIGVCKEIIAGLARRAGADPLEKANCEPVDRWLEALRQRWHTVRPQAASRLQRLSPGPAPCLAADPRLEQALLNLLNNAANAATQPISLGVAWTATQLEISVRDAGPGFPEAVLAQGGLATFPVHAGGNGVGLLLTRSAIEQLGGQLLLGNPPDGGALACIRIPLPKS